MSAVLAVEEVESKTRFNKSPSPVAAAARFQATTPRSFAYADNVAPRRYVYRLPLRSVRPPPAASSRAWPAQISQRYVPAVHSTKTSPLPSSTRSSLLPVAPSLSTSTGARTSIACATSEVSVALRTRTRPSPDLSTAGTPKQPTPGTPHTTVPLSVTKGQPTAPAIGWPLREMPTRTVTAARFPRVNSFVPSSGSTHTQSSSSGTLRCSARKLSAGTAGCTVGRSMVRLAGAGSPPTVAPPPTSATSSWLRWSASSSSPTTAIPGNARRSDDTIRC
mmetsp:Transcript_29864/g.89295  ORF Transcript_29864/g.89295 Transcript_29864/m.89295 type:complete len:277 (+) Transcript_29864:390-1220(+)